MTTQEKIDEITLFLDTEPDRKIDTVYDAFRKALMEIDNAESC